MSLSEKDFNAFQAWADHNGFSAQALEAWNAACAYKDAQPQFIPSPEQSAEILNNAGLEANDWADSQNTEPTQETASHKMLEIVINMVAKYGREVK